MTTLSYIESARNPEYKKLNHAEICERITDLMAGPRRKGTIIYEDKDQCLKLSQLYIEYSLHLNKIADAKDFARDALEFLENPTA